MFSATTAILRAGQAATALLLVLSADAGAQAYYPAMHDNVEQALDVDIFEGFSKRRAQGIAPVAQQERWMLYGRFGLVKFRNDFNPQGGGAQVTWRNTGPGLGGKRLFIGFQRRF
jgi:hypothetical protein